MASATDPRYVEPSFQLGPHAEQIFSVSACTKIAEEVVKSVLNGKTWQGEGEEAVWSVQITQQCVVCDCAGGGRGEAFPAQPPPHPRRVACDCAGGGRDAVSTRTHLSPHPLTRSCHGRVKTKIIQQKFPRYKVVVQTVLGQNKSNGVRVASRCLWDLETDNVATYHYQSDSLWCTVMAFGIYTE
jgi:hypothetical protein